MRCQVAQVAPSARPGIMTERVNQPKSVSARPAEHVGNVVVDRMQVLRDGVDRAHLEVEREMSGTGMPSSIALQTMARTTYSPERSTSGTDCPESIACTRFASDRAFFSAASRTSRMKSRGMKHTPVSSATTRSPG
jgi:hypothetical protein